MCNAVAGQVAEEKLYEHWRVNSPDIRQVGICVSCSSNMLNGKTAATSYELRLYVPLDKYFSDPSSCVCVSGE